jgi:hypothetical protein
VPDTRAPSASAESGTGQRTSLREGEPPRLPGVIETCLHAGGFGNPDVLLLRCSDGPRVVKDYAPRSTFIRLSLGRWVTAHEQAVYRRIEEALDRPSWAPRYLGALDELAFFLEFRPGRPVSRALASELPDGFMAELEAAVGALHAAGIVHLDLRHRSNVLADEAGHPVILDFASALMARPGGVAHKFLLATLGWIDRRAVEKWRVRLVPKR